MPVTFRKEGVDWNTAALTQKKDSISSPSVRKVWIEIIWVMDSFSVLFVTFRKEGVDWNTRDNTLLSRSMTVTFRKEGVDWNLRVYVPGIARWRHLP